MGSDVVARNLDPDAPIALRMAINRFLDAQGEMLVRWEGRLAPRRVMDELDELWGG